MIEIRPLQPARSDDFFAFFDGPAWTDNPDWSGCYCMFFHFAGSSKQWSETKDEDNRAAKAALIADGTARGHLAYEEGRVVGWCNGAPRTLLPKLDAFCPVDDAERVGNIVCFVVAHTHRRRGVARALLDAACAEFAAGGLSVAEAFPPKEAEGDADHYRGPLSLYRTAGFEVAAELKDHYQVRKELA